MLIEVEVEAAVLCDPDSGSLDISLCKPKGGKGGREWAVTMCRIGTTLVRT